MCSGMPSLWTCSRRTSRVVPGVAVTMDLSGEIVRLKRGLAGREADHLHRAHDGDVVGRPDHHGYFAPLSRGSYASPITAGSLRGVTS